MGPLCAGRGSKAIRRGRGWESGHGVRLVPIIVQASQRVGAGTTPVGWSWLCLAVVDARATENGTAKGMAEIVPRTVIPAQRILWRGEP
jgi:hypothetical protein